ncbi:MAG: hypothetical protein VB108_07360 [Anaerolineaceae bacterium]|nr:hypothetical protein [Anaerolineaceae bacterium]
MRKKIASGGLLISLLLALLLSACKPEAESLPLSDYQNPDGLYTLQIPKDWSAEYDAEKKVLSLKPAPAADQPESLQVFILTVPVSHPNPDAKLTMIKAEFEPFLEAHIDADQQIINKGETSVDRMNAMIVDFGKPWQQSYLTGREVLVNSASHAIAFLGLGEEKAWQNFLPTFRKILESYHLNSPEPTPLPGGYRP